VRRQDAGGWGLDAVWADDFHHQVRRCLAGDADGYYRDYAGALPDLAKTIRDGWFYQGQRSVHLGRPRGTDPTGEPLRRYLVCLQNHDQIGNRACGERLHHQIAPAAWRAASTLLLLVPETPLLFMGQEWAASTPFLYFTDHHPELGRLVTQGRRGEFKSFAAFSEAAARARIPDPQAEDTFARSRLDWEERAREPHAGSARLYRELLAVRREERTSSAERDAVQIAALDTGSLALHLGPRPQASGHLLLVVRLLGSGEVRLPSAALALPADAAWKERLSTEDPRFAPDAQPLQVRAGTGGIAVAFTRPGAVVLTCAGASSIPART
jgi:maltooligosyltrehalose trehalohydrolase